MTAGTKVPAVLVSTSPLQMPEELIVRRLRADDSISAITRLLHQAYAPLAAMGFRYTATHQNDEVTQLRVARGQAWVAEAREDIVGTITLYDRPSPSSNCGWYLTPGVWTVGQFAVHPSLQRQGLGSRLIHKMEDIAASGGATELALDTAENAHHLVDWYQKIGYRFIEYADWSSTNYRSVILSKALPSPQP